MRPDHGLDRIFTILAGLPRGEVTRRLAHARALHRRRRHRSRDEVIRFVREELLADLDCLPAAVEIDRAVRGAKASDDRATGTDRARRAAIRRRLEELLGPLDEMPGVSRLRQILAGK